MNRRIMLGLAGLISAGMFAGCSIFERDGEGESKTHAIAELHDAKGAFVGVAFFTEEAGSVRINLKLRGLPAGDYAIHIHEFACVPGDMTSPGGHFNPFGRQHGLLNPQGPHAGDLPNISVGENGGYEGTMSAPLVSLSKGTNSLFKPGGTSLVVHSGADDGRNQDGKQGERVACGTIRTADAPPNDASRRVSP